MLRDTDLLFRCSRLASILFCVGRAAATLASEAGLAGETVRSKETEACLVDEFLLLRLKSTKILGFGRTNLGLSVWGPHFPQATVVDKQSPQMICSPI